MLAVTGEFGSRDRLSRRKKGNAGDDREDRQGRARKLTPDRRRDKSDRPLDCWKEVEAFKSEVSKLEQVSGMFPLLWLFRMLSALLRLS